MQSSVKIQDCYNNRVNLHCTIHFLHLFFYSFFSYSEDEEKWMVVVMCEEREIIKKKKIYIYILIKCSIK